ncbi:MAG: putative membrane protein [Candidatus Shapirobacteria bacterium GW2011_GWE1_38_10]|uniref:Putative membrane protein n=1 Tax=Candidatus Shapirobacteria bacterium GW2011_GWE1_38_10 TaxID=1618488 RepID=A0A0G0LB35_9BACT|nr:MAG: putative membrane protein [Candidatus Shapirobacteria bacterium GW2011_GWF2_37_20]KKQ49886.1 MAG: putative membrane protein [Candidatus Shapirobacteria bacterium GW2011_GWE1_38_10]KKQ64184.1 MAG: putative membrane protein [Candidatus Shapirobacteria bacterium GW2011_GWF1_38_23]HBP50730.1 hypothetical protein [Candidatus Shapirobacteria bacterium]
MTRAKNLDMVAPDDMVETKRELRNEIVENKVEPAMVKDINKTKKKKMVAKTDITGDLNDRIYGIVGHTKHSLSSLLVNPHVFDFEERAAEEKIILVARPHWFTNVSWIIISILLVLAPSLLGFIPIIDDIPARFKTIGVLVWYLITFAYAFENFLSWYFDVYIITDERVIDISFNNLLDKKFSEAKLSMIQDVTSRVSGLGQTMFNYGTVYIQTAAEVAEIQFEMIPNPEKIIKVLQLLRQEEERETLEGRVR